MERTVFEMQLRGVRVILGHPERSPIFQDDPAALARLVDRGVLTSVTASALRGRAGDRARDCAIDLFEAGLVHNVASDGHSPERRRPDLIGWRAELEGVFHDSDAAAEWMTVDVPEAILSNEDVPAPQFQLKRRWRPSGRRRKRVASTLAG
jgi:protein-tyrosine phosphatase